MASGADPQLTTEAISVVKKMNRWNPALIRGVKIASYAILPIEF
jgi:hypothetical protein